MTGNFGLGWLFSSKKPSRSKSQRRRDTRSLRVEMLESKLPLAGNITATLAGGILTLSGDAANNSLYLTGAGGVVRAIGQGTTVNGQALAQFNGVTDIDVLTNGGNDAVTGVNLTLTGSLYVRLDSTTAGNDSISLVSVNLGGSLDIGTDPTDANGFVNSSAGTDLVSLTNITVGDDIYVATGRIGAAAPGAARDTIVGNRITANNNNVARANFSQFQTGQGPDSIALANLNINSNLFVDASPDFGNSSAADVVSVSFATINGALDIRTDDVFNGNSRGNDVATVNAVSADSLNLSTQGGNDVVTVLNSTFGTPPFGVAQFISAINAGGTGGADRDTVTITNTDFFGGLNLTTGVDADYVTITLSLFYGPGVVAQHTAFDLGDGNDIFTFNSNQIDDLALIQLFGGLGTDVMYAFYNTNLGGQRVIFPQGNGFEAVVSL